MTAPNPGMAAIIRTAADLTAMAHNALDPEIPDPAEIAIVAIAHWCQIFHGLIAPAADEPGAEPGVYPDADLWPLPTFDEADPSETDATYVCPQCGPDPAGSDAHTRSRHIWPFATDEDLNGDTVPRPFRAPTFDPLTRAARLLGDS